jgi:hypothetical protein
MSVILSLLGVDPAWAQLWSSKDPVYVKFNFASPEKKRKRKRSRSSSSSEVELVDLLTNPQQPPAVAQAAGTLKLQPAVEGTAVVDSISAGKLLLSPPATPRQLSLQPVLSRPLSWSATVSGRPGGINGGLLAVASDKLSGCPKVSSSGASINGGIAPLQVSKTFRRPKDGGSLFKHVQDTSRKMSSSSSQSCPSSPLAGSPSVNLIERHKIWLMSPGSNPSPRLLVQPLSPPKKKIKILQSIAYK